MVFRIAKQPKVSETICTKEILSYLSKIGIFAWRNNTGSMKAMSGRFVRFGYPGSSDILGLLPDGRILCIEVKSMGEPFSAKQKEFRYLILLNKGVYLAVVSLDDLVKQLGEL